MSEETQSEEAVTSDPVVEPAVTDAPVYEVERVRTNKRGRPRKVAENGIKSVTNNYASQINLFGVYVDPGETEDIPNFKMTSTVKFWIETKVISVE